MAKILIAEDQDELREMITTALHLEGYQVVATADGDEALEAARRTTPDLVILDIQMPNKSGYQVFAELKLTRGLEDTPVIIISALDSEEEIQAGLAAGAEYYLCKPFAPQELTDRIKELLEPAESVV